MANNEISLEMHAMPCSMGPTDEKWKIITLNIGLECEQRTVCYDFSIKYVKCWKHGKQSV